MPASRSAKRAVEAARLAERTAREIETLPKRSAAALRALRRHVSSELAFEPADFVLAVARSLLGRGLAGANVVAYELVRYHPGAEGQLGARELEVLGAPMRTWGDVDTFACYLAGRAWRAGRIGDDVVHRWARSEELWWRRAALVSTVPLNVRAQGGAGDAARTLAVCTLLVDDREDLVVKALSWALRALAVREPEAVARFVRAHRNELAPRVLREVESKLATGAKRGTGTRHK